MNYPYIYVGLYLQYKGYRNNHFALPRPALHLMLIYYDCKSFPGVPENMITAVLYLVGQVGKCLTPIAGKLITARF